MGAESTALTSQSYLSIQKLRMGGGGVVLIHSPSFLACNSCTFQLPYYGALDHPITPPLLWEERKAESGKRMIFFHYLPEGHKQDRWQSQT